MELDLQKASVLKRVAAALVDLILIAILATGFLWLLNAAFGYDDYNDRLTVITQKYADEYGLNTALTQEEFNKMTPAEQDAYMAAVDQADAAINADEEAVYLYNMVVNLAVLNVSLSILLAMTLGEFVVPLFFGNGQTLGKKIFSLCLIRTDSVQINNVQLFARVLLGKYAVGTMIPIYAAVMLMMGTLSGGLLLAVAGLLLGQCICLIVTSRNALLHDLLAGTVVVDYNSQQIFRTTEDLVEHQKRVAAERAARQTY